MVAVGLGSRDVLPYLTEASPSLCIAAINSPHSVTISGDKEPIHQLCQRLIQDKVLAKILNTNGKAYHSSHSKSYGAYYENICQSSLDEINKDIANENPRLPVSQWQSSVDPNASAIRPSTAYWRRNLESPVLFLQAVERVLDSTDVNMFIEIGPHSALKGPIRQIVSNKVSDSSQATAMYYPTLERDTDSFLAILTLCGQLFIQNAPIDLVTINSIDTTAGNPIRSHASIHPDLPKYQYSYGPVLYSENRYSRELRGRRFPRHDLLGSSQPGKSSIGPSWRNVLRNKDIPWLQDHKVRFDVHVLWYLAN